MANLIRFGGFVVDLDRRLVTHDGVPVAVQPKVLQLLILLVESYPAAVHKRRIYETLWPDVIVEEANVHNLVADLRNLLGDSERTVIRTIHRYGYALAADLERSSHWEIRIGDRRVTLKPGENIVGRDDDADVRIDEPSVSRRHARIVVSEAGLLVSDLESKNGTTVDGEPLQTEAAATDGSELIFGAVRTRVRRIRARAATVTL